jgi:hypothetical protein
MGQLGWSYGRLRIDDKKQKRGFRRMWHPSHPISISCQCFISGRFPNQPLN